MAAGLAIVSKHRQGNCEIEKCSRRDHRLLTRFLDRFFVFLQVLVNLDEQLGFQSFEFELLWLNGLP